MESRRLLAASGVVISEFMADNDTGLKDYYGQASDWIELRNLDSTPRDLSGWHLKDGSATDFTFPANTSIAAGGYVLVFASGRSVVKAPNGEFHANFKLSSSGEYLGLLRPDNSVAFEYAPQYPPQYTDVSYGLATQVNTTTLLGPGAAGRWTVPTSADGLDPNWFGPGFSDAGWTAGTTGLGFDTNPSTAGNLAVLEVHGSSALANVQDAINLILSGNGTRTNYAATSVNFVDPQNAAGGHFASNTSFGGNTAGDDDNVAVRVRGTIHITTAGTYTFGVNSDDGFSLRLAGATFTTLTNCSNTTGGDTMEFAGTRAAADSFGQTTLAAGDYEFELHYYASTGASGVELFSAAGAKTLYDSTFRLVGDTANGGLPLVKTADLLANNPAFQAAAQNVNASAFLRLPFDVVDVSGVAGLNLRMKYDDGFVAYLNGQEVARVNAPSLTTWNSAATADRLAGDAVRYQDFDLTDFKGLLLEGNNVLAIQGLNSSAADVDFLLLPKLDMQTQAQAESSVRYFVTATPRAANGVGVADLGPIVTDVSTPAAQPGDNDAIVVTARVRPATNPLAGAPTLVYRVMYNAEQTTAMFDDGPAGGHGDAAAGDGIWTGTITASASTPGQMVRWYVRATDTLGQQGRWPILVPVVGNDGGPEYEGTVIANPTVSSTLPVFEWFTNNVAGANGSGARGSVYYLNEFYDNVFIRDRGANTTNGNKFEFNSGYDFKYAADRPRVNEFNLNQRGAQDVAYVRPVLSFETFEDAGVPSLTSFPMRTHLNGVFANVSLFIGQVQGAMFERFGWYGNGSLYKLTTDVPRMDNASAYEKKNRDQEDRSDLSSFLTGIHLTGTALTKYLYDNVNIPVMLDYIAANVLVNDDDDAQKNYYLFRDTNDGANAFYDGANAKGTNEWTMIPWDKDLTFGMHFGFSPYTATDPYTHPFFPDSNHPKNDGPNAWNWLIDALLDTPAIKQMYVRRLRTMMDEMLQPLGTPAKDRYYDQRLDELFAQLSGDPSFTGGSLTALTTAFNDLKTKYLDVRRTHLYIDHSLNTVYPDYAGIPAQQNGSPTIQFGQYDATPGSGNQDHEYLTLVNPNTYAVDISDWRLGGGVEYTFKKGTVIPPGGTLYVSPNVFAFRNRPGRSPTAIEFVQGNYNGHLSRLGEVVTLSDPHGKQIGSLTTANQPSAAQQSLRVTEVMYHPAPPPAGSPYVAEDFAYIEVKNVGAAPLSLAGVKFTDGVSFDFTGGNVQTLAPGGFALVVANLAAFQSRYGNAFDSIIAGTFAPFAGQTAPSGLDNAGEHVRLADAQGETVLAFDYKDGWYTQTDGGGNSLVIRNAAATPDTWDTQSAWAASAIANGSPGADDPAQQLAPGAIVVNELLSNTATDPHGTWVEFRNTTANPIDVGGWFLSDDGGDLKKYQIAAGTVIPANGYITFDRVTHFGNAADPGRLKAMALDPTGGSIYLTSASGGVLADYQTSESYDAAAPETTLGRYLISTGEKDFVALAASTYGAANVAPAVGPVVISEVMYHPSIGGNEYVELRNTTGAAINVAGWRLNGGIDFTFPAGASIPANGYALVVKTLPSFFRTKYAIPAAVPIFGAYGNALNNDDDRVELERPGTPATPGGKTPYYRVDQLRYTDTVPWPAAADGLKASLNRISPTDYGDDVANWQAGHATPGAAFVAFDATAPSVPSNLSTQVLTPTQTKITWNAANDPQSGVAFYYVYANGNRVAATTSTTFTDTWVVSGQPARNYQVSAVNADGVESFLSGTVLSASVVPVTPDPRTTAVNQLTIVFNAPVTGFDLADLSLKKDGGPNLLTGAQTLTTVDNVTWTLGNLSALTGAAGNYVLTLSANGSGIVNNLGDPLAADAGDAWVVDLTGPTVAVNPVTPDPRTTATDQITIVFNEAVVNFDLSDLTLKRNGGANLLTASQTLSTTDNITWTLGNLGGLTYIAGTYQLDVLGGGGVTDLAGNALAAAASDSWVMSITAQTPFDTTDDHLGTVTAQGENGTNEGKLKAFDNASSTKWLDFANANPTTRASWIQYRYANNLKYVVTQYTITSANDAPERDPRDWQLWGSNDNGVTWTVLDTRSGQTFASRFQKNTYSVNNAVAYNVYRLSITSVANPSTANSVQLSEIELIGLPPPPPPTVSQPAFGGTTGRKLSLRFSSDVHNSLAAGDLQVRNTATNQLVTIPAPTYDLPTNTATFSFPADLPDGNYAVTLLAAGVSDGAGSPLDGNGDGVGGDNYTGFTFSYMAGDANHDRAVDFNDLVVLAQNYNTAGGKTFDTGDFTGDGNVDFNDLVVLAQRYNTALPGAPVSAASMTFDQAWAAATASPSTPTTAPVPNHTTTTSKPVAKPVNATPKPVERPIVVAASTRPLPLPPPKAASPFSRKKLSSVLRPDAAQT